jgi:coenzyme F420-reducing hydrogenase delta subunit
MATTMQNRHPKILILATLSGGYAGADAVGQMHIDYPSNTYILPVRTPAMFPKEFYLSAFEQGIDGIIVMYSGTDCPYKGAPERTAQIINHTYQAMKARGIDARRLRLAAICTVCTKPFVKETKLMNELLEGIGYVKDEIAAHAGAPGKESSIGQNS